MNKFSILGDRFIVKDSDEFGEFTLAEAKANCSNLPDGWRVPTLAELECVYNECMEQGTKKLTKEMKFQPKNYLTDTVDEFDGWPLSFDFSDGVSYISTEDSKHALRLVRNEVASMEGHSMTQADFLDQALLVLKKYLVEINEQKFRAFLLESLEFNALNFEHIRYVTLEDSNMCEFSEDFYVAHFHEDNELIAIWEDDYYASGYNQDELDDEEEGLRDGFIGFLDLVEKKYLRVNGCGKVIEYGSENPMIVHPDWSSWC